MPHAFKAFAEILSPKSPAVAMIPATVILTVAKGHRPEDDTFYFSTVRARDRGWAVRIMESDHFPMLNQPRATAALLMEIK